MGKCLYCCGSLLRVYCIHSQVRASFFLSFFCKGTIKSIPFTPSAAIHGCVAVRVAVLGIAVISEAVLHLSAAKSVASRHLPSSFWTD